MCSKINPYHVENPQCICMLTWTIIGDECMLRSDNGWKEYLNTRPDEMNDIVRDVTAVQVTDPIDVKKNKWLRTQIYKKYYLKKKYFVE